MNEERRPLAPVTALIPGPPRSRPVVQAAPAAAAKPETPRDAAPAADTRENPPKTPARKPKTSSTALTYQSTNFSTPRSVRTLLRETVRSNPDTTVAQVVLESVAAAAPHLGRLLAEDRNTGGVGDLFPDAGRAERPTEEAVSVSLRTTTRNLEVLDELADTHNVNRSRLITVSLRFNLSS